MKKIVFIITSAFLIASCNNLKDNEFLITGTAKGIENGKKVFVEIQDENGFITKDTGVIENGAFDTMFKDSTLKFDKTLYTFV